MLWFENSGAWIDMKSCFFLDVTFLEVFFGQVWDNPGKIPSHPQKFACSYTFTWKRHNSPRNSTVVFEFCVGRLWSCRRQQTRLCWRHFSELLKVLKIEQRAFSRAFVQPFCVTKPSFQLSMTRNGWSTQKACLDRRLAVWKSTGSYTEYRWE